MNNYNYGGWWIIMVESSEYDVNLLKLQHFYNTKILQNRTNATVVFWQNSVQCCKNVALKNAMVVNSLYNLCKIRL